MNHYDYYAWMGSRFEQPAETLNAKINLLLEVFAPQVEEIRERKAAERAEQRAAYQERLMEQKLVAEAKRDELNERINTLVAEFAGMDDLGGISQMMPARLARAGFGSIDEIREASDGKLISVDGIGIKTLNAIRRRIHPHEWETFETSEGKSGSYCAGCKARTGFVACP